MSAVEFDVVECEILFRALKKDLGERISNSEVSHGTIIGSGNKWNLDISILFKLAERIGNYD